MGHSRAEGAATRQRIVEIAARRFRESGLAGVGLAEITAEAGITTGGFYRHFASREEMLAEAFEEAARSLEVWRSRSPDIEAAVRNYLSPEHRDAPGIGCPVAALANDVARGGDAVRNAYTAHVRRMLEFVEGLLAAQGHKQSRAKAMFQFSACVGALGFARAVDDPALSEDILSKAAAELIRIGTAADPGGGTAAGTTPDMATSAPPRQGTTRARPARD